MIVTVEWLHEHIQDEHVRIIDCRFDLANPNWGREQYNEAHIPGALYFDLNTDLSSPVTKHGGRHPLPSIEEFVQKLSQAGIDEHTTVVAYDSQGGAMASRLWWLLTYLGHNKAYVLNGGFPAWKEQNLEVVNEMSVFALKTFVPSVQHDTVVTMEELQAKISKHADITLIDSREPKRYAGLEELVDKAAGHIPNAQNYFWKDGVTESGAFKEQKEQEERFIHLDKKKETIVYCGSGVTACPNVLTLKMTGFTNVKLYVGSWSDWISYPENIIMKEKQ
ncbi:sulfurtransferase [Bacillus sp. NPDC077411]|uniref:Sulfurtransferase n=1 Tax=Bacillus bruguierae TaxID=3127667 RepID=A0ABU8FDV4_9BACI|nr:MULTISPECIES: sulfurtransferase [unclassified Bacillus (in: firmicutes)]SFI11881.1 thiosulfate/3-mercaptopyruvate sulfurtransferase [Bacillus sp. 71mf]SFS75610.1 thiosulfate/3-mercaptopyruvate sulfurtransferase [Bacillus sp. 103mf]